MLVNRMDDLDGRIIGAMKKGIMCTPKAAEIAKRLKVPASTVHVRIKKLEKDGIIISYAPVVDYEKAGGVLEGFFLMKLHSGTDIDSFAKRLLSDERIIELRWVSGAWAMLGHIRVKDFTEYMDVVNSISVRATEVMEFMDFISPKGYTV